MEAGLLVHLNSDDPTMFRTDIGKEYVDFVGQNDYPPEVAKQLVRNGVDATWLDATRRPRCTAPSTTRSPRSTRSSCGDATGGAAACWRTPIRRCGARGTPVARSDEVTTAPGADAAARRRLGRSSGCPTAPAGRTLAAFVDRCPHRFAPLSAGWVDGSLAAVRLPRLVLRRRRRVPEIPSLGGVGARAAARASRPTPAAARRAARHGVPRAGGAASPSCSTSPRPTTRRSCTACSNRSRARVGAGLMIDNFLDMAHFPFVHAATIGTPESSTFELRGRAARLRHARAQPPSVPEPRGPRRRRGHPAAAAGTRARVPVPRAVLDLPAHRLRRGGRHERARLLRAARRRRARAASTRPCTATTSTATSTRLAECVAFERKILDEDLALQERYRDRRLPLDLTAEVHVKADRMTIELRRILADLVDAARSRSVTTTGGPCMRIDPVDPVGPGAGGRRRAGRASRSTCSSTGGTVVDVGCGELRAADVGIVGPLVASVHEPGARTDALDVIDCTGRFVAPGLHRHARALRVVDAHARRLRRGGVPARHHHGVRRPARARQRRRVSPACATRSRRAAGLPVRFIVQAPSCVPPQPGLELSGADLYGPDIDRDARRGTRSAGWPR